MASVTKYWNKTKRKHKYNAKTAVYDGIIFDSIFESQVYQDLLWQQKAGEIKEIIRQYPLQLRVYGQLICKYKIDFLCIMTEFNTVKLVEAKGYVTNDWRLKWKLLEALKWDLWKDHKEYINEDTDIQLEVIKK